MLHHYNRVSDILFRATSARKTSESLSSCDTASHPFGQSVGSSFYRAKNRPNRTSFCTYIPIVAHTHTHTHIRKFQGAKRDNGSERLIARHFQSERTRHVKFLCLARSTETDGRPMRTSHAASSRITSRTREYPSGHCSRARARPSPSGLSRELITALHRRRKSRSCRDCRST